MYQWIYFNILTWAVHFENATAPEPVSGVWWKANVISENDLAFSTIISSPGLILDLRPANKRRRYKATLSPICWGQT